MSLSKEEILRYQKQIKLPDFGEEGQLRLKKARVLVVGAGGLGCPVLLYLASAGIGHIGIVDGDEVEPSNLQRQVLFNGSDVQKKKAVVASQKIAVFNPLIEVKCYDQFLNTALALEIVPDYDLVVDCTDNFGTRYLVNDVCALYKKPWVSAAIYKHEGQLGVFNVFLNGGYSCNYRDIYPAQPKTGEIPNCDDIGVTAVLPGLMGLYQANEVIKYFIDPSLCLTNRLLILDSWRLNHQVVELPQTSRMESLTREEIISSTYVVPCSAKGFSSINWDALQNLLTLNKDSIIVDVRNLDEEPLLINKNHIKIPLPELEERLGELSSYNDIVFVCRSGKRSEAACRIMLQHFNKINIYNLAGGLLLSENQNHGESIKI